MPNIIRHFASNANIRGDFSSTYTAVGASEDSRLKVTLMEVGNIADLGGNVPVAAGADRRVLRDFAIAHKVEA